MDFINNTLVHKFDLYISFGSEIYFFQNLKIRTPCLKRIRPAQTRVASKRIKFGLESSVIRNHEMLWTLDFYHECEGRIVKSLPRIAVWHKEASRVMTNGDPEGRIFLSYHNTNNGFFFSLITVCVYFLF